MKLHFRKAMNIYTDASSTTITIPNTDNIQINLVSPGFLVFLNDQIVFKNHCIVIDDTTSVGEMTAIDMAIKWILYIKNTYGFNYFNIFTDSESSIMGIKTYMKNYNINKGEEKQKENTKKYKKKNVHKGLIRLTDNIAYNIIANDLNINFIFIPSHSRADVNIKAIISKMRKKIMTKNENLSSHMPDWKIYDIIVGNATIDLFTREYLLKYENEIINELVLNKDNYEFNVKREYPLLWAPDKQYNTLQMTSKMLKSFDNFLPNHDNTFNI